MIRLGEHSSVQRSSLKTQVFIYQTHTHGIEDQEEARLVGPADTRNVYPVGREISNSHEIASVRNAVRTAVLWLTIRDVPVCEKQTEKGRTWTPLHKTPNVASGGPQNPLRHVPCRRNRTQILKYCTEDAQNVWRKASCRRR